MAIASTAGGADDFAQFLATELISYVDANYRTNDFRILFGHSFGGFFSIYSMLEHPEVFDAYIAASPSVFWNDEQLLELASRTQNGSEQPEKALYVTLADTESDDADDQITKLISALGYARIEYQRLDKEVHTSTPHRSIYDGLQFVFDGWYLRDLLSLFNEVGIKGIHDHFRAVDQRFGYARGTPRSVIDQVGMALFESDRLDDLGELLAHDPKNYPTAPNNINMLARAYADRGNAEKAIEFYSMTLSLSPSNVTARQALIDLGVDVEELLNRLAPSEESLRRLAGRYQTSTGNVLDFRVLDRGLVFFANGPNELVMLSPTEYTLGPGIYYFEFDISEGLEGASLRVRAATTQWQQTEKLD